MLSSNGKNYLLNLSIAYIKNKQKTLFFLADLHTVINRLAFKEVILLHFYLENIDSLSLNTLACLIASGVDPNKCSIFLQSSIPQHTELL